MARTKRQAQSATAHSAPPAARQKRSVWTGVRYRNPDRWAAEVRVPLPRTNGKVWIGVFDSDRDAALAYDAALFCLYGDRPPRGRKFNFPDVPRPDIAEHVRLQLSIADVKDIARKHVKMDRGVLPPPVCTPAENLQVAAAEEEASVNGGLDAMDGSLEETSAPFVFDPEELAAIMAMATGDN